MQYVTGVVTHVRLEGGFFGIRGDDGVNYLPLNLETGFQKDGLRVHFEYRTEYCVTMHQWGRPVRIMVIQKLTSTDPPDASSFE